MPGFGFYAMTNTDPWAFLRTHTQARIAPGRTGHSLPTRALLDFQLDHARARDAVYSTLALDRLLTELAAIRPDPILLHSQATDRRTYLHRPDLGRQLDDASRSALSRCAANDSETATPFDLCVIIADGLSATAVNRHAVAVTRLLMGEAQNRGWSLAPIGVVQQGRVAIGDEIGHGLRAKMLVILIGERPGLSSPDSLGAYLTYRPRPGLTDEFRNCVSNIRFVDAVASPDEASPDSLPYDIAVQKLIYLLAEMKRRRLSGVLLKDEMPTRTRPHTSFPAASARTPEIPD